MLDNYKVTTLFNECMLPEISAESRQVKFENQTLDSTNHDVLLFVQASSEH